MELRENETLHEVNEHIKLIQRAEGLTFGTDAYLLSAYVRPARTGTAVDLGSGTGIIPLLCLTRGKAARFTAIELQPAFCELIGRNAALNGMSDRLRALCADVRDVRADTVGGEVDIVTANPPYMVAGSGQINRADEKALARHEICGGIRDFCGAAGRLLRHGGRFFCVFRPERMADLIEGLREAHLEPKRMTAVQSTLCSTPSLLLVEAVKYASPSLLLTPPLCLFEADTERPHKPAVPPTDTADCRYIYTHCAFPAHFTGENRKA